MKRRGLAGNNPGRDDCPSVLSAFYKSQKIGIGISLAFSVSFLAMSKAFETAQSSASSTSLFYPKKNIFFFPLIESFVSPTDGCSNISLIKLRSICLQNQNCSVFFGFLKGLFLAFYDDISLKHNARFHHFDCFHSFCGINLSSNLPC